MEIIFSLLTRLESTLSPLKRPSSEQNNERAKRAWGICYFCVLDLICTESVDYHQTSQSPLNRFSPPSGIFFLN